MALAALAILGHRSAHSFPIGPVIWDYVEVLGPCVVRTVHCCCHWKTQRHPELVPGTSSASCKSTNTKTTRERLIKPLIPFFVLRKIFNKYKQPRKNDQNPYALFGPWQKKKLYNLEIQYLGPMKTKNPT